jgi:hypothetical protein
VRSHVSSRYGRPVESNGSLSIQSALRFEMRGSLDRDFVPGLSVFYELGHVGEFDLSRSPYSHYC